MTEIIKKKITVCNKWATTRLAGWANGELDVVHNFLHLTVGYVVHNAHVYFRL